MAEDKFNLSYFDVACEKHGFLRKYLHYLPVSRIEMILLVCEPGMTKKMICDELNKSPTQFRDYTPSRLDSVLNIIRGKLHTIHHHALLFGIEDKIKPFSLSQLKRMVEENKEAEKKAENE